MNKIINFAYIYFFKFWSKTGLAPGIFHKQLDSLLPRLKNITKLRKIKGDNVIACRLSDHIQGRIYFMGAYEPIETYVFTNLIEPNAVIIDAGANIGSYSLFCSSKASSGHVYSFEPIEINIKQIKENIRLSNKKNITVVEKGLWNKNETLTFSIEKSSENNLGTFTASSLKNSDMEIKCKVVTLDSFVDENNIKRLDYIKMDIEGAELFALKGALSTVKKFRPTILMEINKVACERFNYKCQDLFEILKEFNYKVFKIESLPANSGFISDFSDIIQANVLFLNEKDQKKLNVNWDYKSVKKYYAN